MPLKKRSVLQGKVKYTCNEKIIVDLVEFIVMENFIKLFYCLGFHLVPEFLSPSVLIYQVYA